jgi:hypothetical protein
LHNAFTLAFQGSKSYRLASTIAKNLAGLETDYAPLSVLYWHLNRIAVVSEHRPSFRALSAFSLDLLKRRIVPRLGDYLSDSGAHTERLMKADTLELACRMLDVDCLGYATSKFRSIPGEYFSLPNDRANLNT